MYDITPIKTPHRMDCGATCLKMLLDYYDIDVDLKQLVKECNTRTVGCSAKDIKRAGNYHGLDIRIYSMDAEEVVRQDRPSIVWWVYEHFCVCCGLDDDGNVVICNPDRGRYRMSVGHFKSFYTGVAIFNGEPPELDEETRGE